MQGPSDVSPLRSSNETVRLSPAACKSLNEVAAQLWIMAYNQQYTPKQAGGSTHQGAEPVEHLTQVGVLPANAGCQAESGCDIAAALLLLLLTASALVC